jgi:hypothetical protein
MEDKVSKNGIAESGFGREIEQQAEGINLLQMFSLAKKNTSVENKSLLGKRSSDEYLNYFANQT